MVWWHLLKKSFIENFIFYAVAFEHTWALEFLEEVFKTKLIFIPKWQVNVRDIKFLEIPEKKL